MSDLFDGYWELDPAQNHYEFGDAPTSANYQIELLDGVYHVTMRWVTVTGQEMEMRYEAIPNGIDYPAGDNPAVDTVSTTRVNDYTLDTEVKKAGVTIAKAHRVLSEDTTLMTITQYGKYPDGRGMFANRSVYYRKQQRPLPE